MKTINLYIYKIAVLAILIASIIAPALHAQDREFLYGDMLPDAPELAERGPLADLFLDYHS